jgi:hypothetical protein
MRAQRNAPTTFVAITRATVSAVTVSTREKPPVIPALFTRTETFEKPDNVGLHGDVARNGERLMSG